MSGQGLEIIFTYYKVGLSTFQSIQALLPSLNRCQLNTPTYYETYNISVTGLPSAIACGLSASSNTGGVSLSVDTGTSDNTTNNTSTCTMMADQHPCIELCQARHISCYCSWLSRSCRFRYFPQSGRWQTMQLRCPTLFAESLVQLFGETFNAEFLQAEWRTGMLIGYPWSYWIRKAMESKLFRPIGFNRTNFLDGVVVTHPMKEVLNSTLNWLPTQAPLFSQVLYVSRHYIFSSFRSFIE